MLLAGAQLTVEGASAIADRLDLGEGFVGLTLVALGTALPELVTSIAAAALGGGGAPRRVRRRRVAPRLNCFWQDAPPWPT